MEDELLREQDRLEICTVGNDLGLGPTSSAKNGKLSSQLEWRLALKTRFRLIGWGSGPQLTANY